VETFDKLNREKKILFLKEIEKRYCNRNTTITCNMGTLTVRTENITKHASTITKRGRSIILFFTEDQLFL
jgi:hypothetical protein